MTSPQETTDTPRESESKKPNKPRPQSWSEAVGMLPIKPGLPRVLAKADIPDLVSLEKLCFSVPWSAKQYETVLGNEPFHVFGIRHDAELVGYLTLFAADWEMEILNIAVNPAHRRRGHARRMLDHVLHLCRKMGIKRGYLEVRRSNVPAQNLYAASGFKEVGVRKRYYPDNREDAIIMRLDMEPDAETSV
jgi:[ribosomal protein S18]-alanine N-acetyltransferase